MWRARSMPAPRSSARTFPVNGGAAQSTLGTTAAASSTSQSAANTATTDAKEQVASADNADDEKKKKGKGPVLSTALAASLCFCRQTHSPGFFSKEILKDFRAR